MERELVLVKLGGSLLTDKRGTAAARPAVIQRLAGELARGRGRMGERSLLLGHGSGSFGHVAAARYGLGAAPATGSRVSGEGVSVTQREAARLHRLVIDALLAAGETPFSAAPSSFLVSAAGRPVAVAAEPVARALAAGLLPVVYGDVVTDRRWGAAICSTETALLALVRRLRRRGYAVRRALWMGETEGVYDRSGKTVPRIDAASFRRLRRLAAGAAGTDVTGGMLHRLEAARALARLGIESWICDGRVAGRLEAALAGEEVPATRFLASR